MRSQVEKDYFVDGDKQLKVTISLVVADFEEGDTKTSLFDRADKALYVAKNNGRNRVELA